MVLFCLWNCFQNQFNYQVIHLIQYREGSQIFWLIYLKRKLSFCAKPFPRCYRLPVTSSQCILLWSPGPPNSLIRLSHRICSPHCSYSSQEFEAGIYGARKKKKKSPWALRDQAKLTITIVGLQKWSFYKELGVSDNPLGFRSIISSDGTFKYIAWILHALIQIQPFLSFPLNSQENQ